jgi:MFS family permease
MRIISSLFHVDMTKKDDRNAVFLVAEIFFASIMGGASAFNAAFAVRLGATNSQIGLLSSIPALLALIVSIPAGRFIQKKAKRKPWLLGTLTLSRVSMLMVALSPFIHAGSAQGLLVVSILIIMSAPASFFNVGFIPMLADVIPEENRASVFTARNVIAGATTSVSVFLFGQMLNRMTFPVNYQIMFVIGWVVSMLSYYFLSRLQVPDSKPVVSDGKARINLREQGHILLQAFREQPAFMRITRNTILLSIGLWIAGPLYILFFVRSLQANDAWIGLQSTVSSLSTIFGFAIFRWIMARWGEPNTLKRTALAFGAYPVLVGPFPSLTLILFFAVINGFFSSGFSLSQLNQLMKAMPEEKRPEYTALYYTTVNVGAFLFPLVGVALANVFGIGPTLIGCGVLALIGGTSFWFSPVIIDLDATNSLAIKETSS